MRHFFEWFAEQGNPSEPWLVLGKGPSFGLRGRFDLTGYHLLSLNHAVREQPVRLAHMIDLDVVDACGDVLPSQAGYVVLPWYPHVRNSPGSASLAEIVPGHPLLRRMADEGRLLWYDLSTAARRHGPGPVVQATYFSAEAAVGLLALAGVRRVRSLGVDGGAGYSADFEDLAGRTLLANGQPAFDLQFRGIARTILRTGLDFAPLDQASPIDVCIRSDEPGPLPGRVLEFSLRRHTSMSVRVYWDGSPDGARTSRVESRRAIVLRANALVVDDLRKLWSRPHGQERVEVPRGRAEAAVWLVTSTGPRPLEAMCRAPAGAGGFPEAASLPESWNRRDLPVPGDTSLLVYDAAGLRPWVSRAHPYAHLWVGALIEAVREGFISLDLVRAEVRLGRVRPSLLEQVERGRPESLLVSWSARRSDSGFSAPGGGPAVRAGRFPDPLPLIRALARQARREVGDLRRRRIARGSQAPAPQPGAPG